MSLTLALAKGRLLDEARGLLAQAGLPAPQDDSRRLVLDHGSIRYLLVKDVDVPTYVEYGTADCGIVGRDVLLEHGADVYEPLDLGFGRCRLMLARRRGSVLADHAVVRVATKYPHVARRHFLARGVAAEVVRLSGSVELGAVLGLADCILDVVDSGRTLADNGLEAYEEIAACSARLVVNRASYHARRDEVAGLVAMLRAACLELAR